MKALSEQICDYLIPWKNLEWPLDLDALFSRKMPMVLEIGFGDGSFLIDIATRFPERNYVGIELAWDPIQRLFKKIEHLGLSNVKVLRCDAGQAITSLFQTDIFEEVFINHPDPWPKERHHRRRLLQRSFLKEVAASLIKDGQLTIATDHADYASWIAEILESQDELTNTLKETRVPTLEGRIITRYQRKAQEEGIGNHFFVWKRAMDQVEKKPTLRKEDMPNVALRGEVDLEAVFDGFEQLNFQERNQNIEVLINLVRAFKQHGEPHFLVETMIKEGRLNQQVGINVLKLEDGKITVKTSAIGFPRATWGMKRAIWHVARFVLSRAPQLKIVNSTVGDLID